jgi:hypothetical protein
MNRIAALTAGSLSLVAVVLAAGCAKPEVIPSSGPRQAIPVDQVTIYEKQPHKYEDLGPLTVTQAEGARWDERGDANQAFDNLKAKAAAMGANGVLLEIPNSEFDRYATAGYHGKFYQVAIKGSPGKAVTKAIYVLKK